MGGASGTHGEEDKCVLEFGAKTYMREGPLGNLIVWFGR